MDLIDRLLFILPFQNDSRPFTVKHLTCRTSSNLRGLAAVNSNRSLVQKRHKAEPEMQKPEIFSLQIVKVWKNSHTLP